MSFGYSIGDVIAVSILIKDVFKALDSAGGSSTEYQELIRELWSLDRALLEVEALSRLCDTTIELNALSQTVRRVADQCKDCIQTFLTKIKGYERSLGGGDGSGGGMSKVRSVGMKIKWGLMQKDELASFRAEINAHSSAINIMLLTANIKLTKLTGKSLDSRLEDAQQKRNENDHQQLTILGTIQNKLDENSRHLEVHSTNTSRLAERLNYFFTLGAELKSFMSKIWTMNLNTYNAVVEIQSRIPKEFGPCWIQEPLILTNALGRVAPIHLELVNNWDVFDSVLAARFIDLPGERKIARGEYVIHEPNLVRDLDRSEPFAACFMPGHHLDMMVVYKSDYNWISNWNSCPGCKTESKEESSTTIHCTKCGVWFQRITDLDEALDTSPQYSKPDYISRLGKGKYSGKRSRHLDRREEDDIRAFKRVRLLRRGGFTTRRPRITKSDRARMKQERLDREKVGSMAFMPGGYGGMAPLASAFSLSSTPMVFNK